MIQAIDNSNKMRMPIAASSPVRRARSCCDAGNLLDRIEMKMTLSTPSTISRNVRVTSARRPADMKKGEKSSPIGGSPSLQAMALLERGPVVLQTEKCREIVATEKRVGVLFESDRGARAHAVIVTRPHRDLVGKIIEEPAQALPFEAGVLFVRSAANFTDKKQIAGNQQPIRRF